MKEKILQVCTKIYAGCGIKVDADTITRDVSIITAGIEKNFPNISEKRLNEVAECAIMGEFGEIHNFTPNMFFSWLKEIKERKATVTNQQLQLTNEAPKLLNAHQWTEEDSVEECRKYLTTDADTLPFVAPPFVEQAWRYLVDKKAINAEKLAIYEEQARSTVQRLLPADKALKMALKGEKITLVEIEKKKLHLQKYFNYEKNQSSNKFTNN